MWREEVASRSILFGFSLSRDATGRAERGHDGIFRSCASRRAMQDSMKPVSALAALSAYAHADQPWACSSL